MRTFLTLLSLGIAVFGLLPAPAMGQMVGDPLGGYVQGGQPQAASAFQTRLPVGWPGNVWFEANLADNGLGYDGSYMTLGGKSRLFEDWFDGRWMLEAQGHLSLDRGGFFSNVGIERAFTIDAAGSDVYFSTWFDHDSDQATNFSHSFNQLGLSAGIRSRMYDIYANGYLPSGNTNFAQGDPTGQTVFFQHGIVTQAGIDSALQGFDAHVKVRPEALAFLNGYVDVGTYAYQSDLVDTFAGGSAKIGIQTLRGMVTSIQLNHDNQFQTTGVLQFGWVFGARGSRTEYSPVGRDLEATNRNDHIVRVQRGIEVALDPDTGQPYVVFHVDNTAAAGGDGSFERPFRTLAEAQAASPQQAIIYVHQGNGTTLGMANGIVLKTGQLFLGDGIVHNIPVVGGTFNIFNNTNGLAPVITNTGGDAVTLASDNTVRNFTIDGSAGGMTNGIRGTGGLTDGIIEDVTILGTPILNGISLDGINGDWRFARNNISTALQDGIFIDNMTGSTSTLTFLNNTVSSNVRDGIHVEDFDGSTFLFTNNTTSDNVRDGLRMERYNGVNGTFTITNHVADNNNGFGIRLDTLNGTVSVTNPTLTNNAGGGISMNNVAGTTTISGATVTGNGTGIFNTQNTATQTLLVTNSTISNNTLGIFSQASGTGVNLTTNIVDNIAINNNQTDAIRVISTLGASHTFLLENTVAPLTMTGNANLTGVGISIFAEDGGANLTTMNSTIRNINLVNTGNGAGVSGILVSGQGNSQSSFTLRDVVQTTATGGNALDIFLNTNNTLINTINVDGLTQTGLDADGTNISINNTTRADLFFNNVNETGSTSTGGRGFDLVANDNSIVRLQLLGSTFNSNNLDGVRVRSNDSSRVLADLLGNTANDNGRSDVPVADVLPFEHGFLVQAANASNMTVTMTSNNAHANFERGLRMETLNTANMNASLAFNSFTNNDLGEDTNNDPIPDSFIQDVLIQNGGFGSAMNVALSNNFFALDAGVTNLGLAASHQVELDGNTNQVPPTLTNVTLVPFGTVVDPNVAAERTLFSGFGFP